VPSRTPTRPFELVGVDLVGPLPVTARGHNTLLVCVDYYTRWPVVVPLRDATAASVAEALVEYVFLAYGAPEVLLSDQGAQFTSELLECIAQLFITRQVYSSGYRPQTAGLVERFNRTIVDMLAKMIGAHHRDWDTYVPYVLWAYRTSFNPAVGNTPFYLMHGYEPTGPEDFIQLPATDATLLGEREYNRLADRLNEARSAARQALDIAKARAKVAHDQRHRLPINYEVGDIVMAYAPYVPPGGSMKFAELYRGPFRIEKILSSERTVSLVNLQDGTTRLAHVENLKRVAISPDRPAVDVQVTKVYTDGTSGWRVADFRLVRRGKLLVARSLLVLMRSVSG
jgi:hypothetical protein